MMPYTEKELLDMAVDLAGYVDHMEKFLRPKARQSGEVAGLRENAMMLANQIRNGVKSLRDEDEADSRRVKKYADDLRKRKAEAPAQPDGATPTSAPPIVVEGVTFRSYRYGVDRYEHRSDCGRARAGVNFRGSTYSASVDGQSLGSRFYSRTGAMKAAVKYMRKNPVKK